MKAKLLFIPMLCIPFIALAKPSDLVCKKRVDLEMGYEQHCVYSGSLSQAFRALGARVELWKPFLKYGLPKKDSDFRGYLAEKDGRTKYYMGLNGRGRIGFLFLLVGMRRTIVPWLHSNKRMARY